VLTNGGGKPEADRVAELSAKLNVPLTTANFIQSHTPFQELVADHNAGDSDAEGLRDKTVLVTGSDPERSRVIAEGYGFRSVITPADLLAAAPAIWPFNPLMTDVYANTARPLPRPLFSPEMGMDSLSECLKIDAIFVFNDPRDWALDIQLITDLMLSHAGYLGTYSRFNGSTNSSNLSELHGGWQEDGQPRLFFSNPDLFWSTGYHLPRFGQGAFQAAMRGVWSRITDGKELICTVIGKPHRDTYRFAERKLDVYRKDLLARLKGHHGGEEQSSELTTVYMVGDNPESDIAGANAYRSELGADWQSILVKTGVWNPERTGGVEGLKGRLKPGLVVDDVQSAVREAMRREGWVPSALPER
jgi:HAD superfamily hydrolase (TIGR01450 family)